MSSTLRYIKEKGAYEEKDYPYKAVSSTCKTLQATKWKISDYQDGKTCELLMNGIQKGPVSVAVDATKFASYKGGILSDCGSTPNSGSLVVGVNDNYWKLKESFGSKFGENGYVRIAPGNTCAVCQMVSFPQLL